MAAAEAFSARLLPYVISTRQKAMPNSSRLPLVCGEKRNAALH
jgi:hypothetical protein